MKEYYHCFRTADYRKVLEQLEEWSKNGWNLSQFFIHITHGPGGFHVFYDSQLDKSATRR